MAESSFDRYENAMLGHALADNFQGSTYMGLSLSESLRKVEQFNPADVMSRYLYLHYLTKCPMGQATKLVYEELKENIANKTDQLTRKQFLFSIERIHSASRSAHDKLKGLSGGCNPAQRSFPLALCPWIKDGNLFQAACDEARLTHFSTTAGQVSGIVNLICRYLLKGDDWNVAVSNAFSTASNLLGEIREIRNRYEHDTVLNSQGHPAYAPNTLHTSLYCITNSDSFESALKLAYEIEKTYCPVLVGLLAGIRWGVPQSVLGKFSATQLRDIRLAAKYFSDEWKKQSTLKNESKKNTFSFSKIFS